VRTQSFEQSGVPVRCVFLGSSIVYRVFQGKPIFYRARGPSIPRVDGNRKFL
jgi:hypothetical protein